MIERDSPFFKYDGSVDMTNSLIVHGSIKFCSVRQGLFGVSYNEGTWYSCCVVYKKDFFFFMTM